MGFHISMNFLKVIEGWLRFGRGLGGEWIAWEGYYQTCTDSKNLRQIYASPQTYFASTMAYCGAYLPLVCLLIWQKISW